MKSIMILSLMTVLSVQSANNDLLLDKEGIGARVADSLAIFVQRSNTLLSLWPKAWEMVDFFTILESKKTRISPGSNSLKNLLQRFEAEWRETIKGVMDTSASILSFFEAYWQPCLFAPKDKEKGNSVIRQAKRILDQCQGYETLGAQEIVCITATAKEAWEILEQCVQEHASLEDKQMRLIATLQEDLKKLIAEPCYVSVDPDRWQKIFEAQSAQNDEDLEEWKVRQQEDLKALTAAPCYEAVDLPKWQKIIEDQNGLEKLKKSTTGKCYVLIGLNEWLQVFSHLDLLKSGAKARKDMIREYLTPFQTIVQFEKPPSG
ncbi:MAG: hypothetical protein OXC30_03175 [Alphaproteobacteria bacterium]|nr:hypothetical protein [Alphaproteobacteria bacterium]